jgi:hypothetical protein
VIGLKRTLLLLAIALAFSAMAQVKAKTNVNVSAQQSMYDFNWKHRLLVIQIASENVLQQLQEDIRYHTPDVKARKLLVLVQVNIKTYVIDASAPNTHSKILASEQLSKEVVTLLQKNQGKVLLVGLDGGIKSRYAADTFTLEQAFEEIDLMPMRRFEIKGSS